jgi:L-amino acid N-acyltransferase YncA
MLLFDSQGSVFSLTTAVHPDYQGRGIATAMTRRAQEVASSAGHGNTFALVAPSNAAQLNVYLNKCGFVAEQLLLDLYPASADYGAGRDRLLLSHDCRSPQCGKEPELFVDVSDRSGLVRAYAEGLIASAVVRSRGSRTTAIGFLEDTRGGAQSFPKALPQVVPDARRLSPVKSHGLAQAVQTEHNTRNPQVTHYFLRALTMLGALTHNVSRDGVRGIAGILPDSRHGAYLHGPATTEIDVFVRLSEEMIDTARAAGRRRLVTIAPLARVEEEGVFRRLGFVQAGRIASAFPQCDGLRMVRHF